MKPFRNQKTIYIAFPEIWESMKALAQAADKSISQYLVDLHEENIARIEALMDQSKQIAKELEIVDNIPDFIDHNRDNTGYPGDTHDEREY